MRRALILGAVLVVCVVGCSDSGGADTSAPDTAALAPSQTAVAPSDAVTTAPATTPTTTAPAAAPTRFFPSHEEAATALFDAWQAGDRGRAAEGATPEAVQTLFATPPQGFYQYGCDTGEFDSGTCNYRTDTMYAKFISMRTDPGWQVTSVIISTDG